MNKIVSALCVTICVVPTVAGTQQLLLKRDASVNVVRPMIVGFFPPSTDAELKSDDGVIEGVAHLRYALEDTMTCLKDSGKPVDAEILLTSDLVIADGARREHIKLSTEWPKSVGVYLLAPGGQAQVVYADPSPSALNQPLTDAAAKYFGAPKCAPK
jgi:hypothetical protein